MDSKIKAIVNSYTENNEKALDETLSEIPDRDFGKCLRGLIEKFRQLSLEEKERLLADI